MIFLLTVYTLLSTAVKGADVTNPSRDADNYRSLPDIIWSCLTTIFLCTWVSLHPNVPKPVNETKLSMRESCAHNLRVFLKDSLLPFLLLLFAPEWILMWAIRQRLTVEWMVRNRKAPTRGHGFFIIMGGFHKFNRIKTPNPASSDPAISDPVVGLDAEKLFIDEKDEVEDHGEADHPLDRFDVCRLVDEGKLELPLAVEIDDKSKSDWIAKSLVLLQTLWFVIQCIARRVEHLPLTELEVVTLGYALLNLVVYVIWWDKPQKVTRPIRVFCGDLPERCDEQLWYKRKMERATLFDKLFDPVLGTQDRQVDLRSLTRVPTFYSGNPPINWPLESLSLEFFAIMVTAVIGGLFGGIHFIAWSSPFPTHKMLILWRCGSILMTVAPLPTFISCIALLFSETLKGVDNTFVKAIRDWIVRPLIMLSTYLSFFPVPFVYVAGRLITLILAFQTLASLPSDAFWSVQWTNFLPHI